VNARVISIQRRSVKGSDPVAANEAAARVGGGIEGDIHSTRSSRGVLVVDRSTLDAFALAPGDLREQITIEGLPDVTNLPVGSDLRIGGVTLRVNGPCEPCTHIGELLQMPDREEFRKALVGRRGALCTVVAATAPIRLGDAVEVLTSV
jgi:MOSC domain-containing protein YiiM